MTKKIFKYISAIFIYFIVINNSFAKISESCSIKYSPSQEIQKYLKNIRTITKNIKNNSSSFPTKTTNTFKSEALHFYNFLTSTSWGNYYIEWNFKIIEALFNDIPSPLMRDNKRLEGELEYLNNLIAIYAKKGFLNLNIKDNKICEGVDNCNLPENIGESLTKLIKSTRNVMEIIQRASINYYLPTKLCENIVGLSSSECVKIYSTYFQAKQECTNDVSIDKIKKIIENFKLGENAFDKWKEGWHLLLGDDTDTVKYVEREKELLMAELNRQGFSDKQTEQILKNLEEYNKNGGYTLNNNPISNIIKSIKGIIKDEDLRKINQFKKSITTLFSKKEKVPIKDINEKLKEINITSETNYNIDVVYNEMLPLAQMGDLNTNQVVREIMNMNLSISSANNTLERVIPLSKKICNQQGKGKGICK